MNEGVELLCTGDLHLGRHPSRIPDELDGPELSPKAVWLSTVETAIEREVDAVVVAGDVVDQANRYFEAYGAFENGVAELDEAGVALVVVAGNHDHDALPDLVDTVEADALQFLGRDGTWERWTLERDGNALVHFEGWSFPEAHVHDSPLETYDLPAVDDAPRIGVLHGDLDATNSRYAPIESSALEATSTAAWVLGHLHAPGVHIDTRPLALYTGSLQPLDPGERGAHGPWTLQVSSNGDVDVEHTPVASLRYDNIAVDVSDATSPQAATGRISTAIESHVRSAVDSSTVDLNLLRVRLTGRTDAHVDLVDQRASMESDLGFREDSVAVRVESIDVDTRPAIDLDAHADGDSAVGFLASLLRELEDDEANEHGEPIEDDGTSEHDHPSEIPGSLVEDARSAMQRAYTANAYAPLRRETDIAPPADSDAVDALEAQARLLLDELLAQKEDDA